MFDLFFDGMQAFNQVGFLLGALMCLGLGLLILGYSLYTRLHGSRVQGTITGVRDKGNMYYSVFEYTSPVTGQVVQTTSDSGSSLLKGRETGRAVPLYILPGPPEKAVRADSWVWEWISLVFILPGAIFLYVALFSYPFTVMTGVMLAGFGLVGVMKLRRIIIPKAERLAPHEWKASRIEKRRKAQEAMPLTTMEAIMSSTKMQRQLEKERQQQKVAVPVLLLLSLAFLGGGGYFGQKLAHLEAAGLQAAGEVVALESSSDSDGNYTYYPVVRFTPVGDDYIRFKDRVGSNPASYSRGDTVTVLYLEDDPKDSAMIDRGIWNWVLPGALGFFGLLCGYGFVASLRRAAETRPRPPVYPSGPVAGG